jgi:protein kinase A|tara:strand:- start:188 stop:1255 length:1068 start_codon:yes stop_codon:yes gene_type:complete
MGGKSSKKQQKKLEEVQAKYAAKVSNEVGVLTSLKGNERHAILGEGTFGRVVLYNINNIPVAVKALKKRPMLELKQLRHVQDEINILKQANYPFIVRYYSGFQDEDCVYLLLEYIQGGEMFSYLRDESKFSVTRTRLYSAEILLALRFLHLQKIVYRDLKPENLLVRGDGHVIITDFGFAKKLTANAPRTYTTCGTPDYLAPEIIRAKGHREYVDLWALGVLIFEMATGYPPFYTDGSDLDMYKKIIRGERNPFPKSLAKNKPLVNIVNGLLKVDIAKRLGCAKLGSAAILAHKFYKPLKWDEVFQRKVKPEFVPKIKGGAFDTSAFDDYDDNNANHTELNADEIKEFNVFDDVF